MAKPKIKEKRWTVDLEKKIQEEHFSNKDRYSFNPNSEKEIFVIDTPPPYPSGTWHIGAVAQYSMIDVIARSQRLLGKEVYFPWGVDRNGINIEFTVEKKTGRKMKTYDRAEFLDLCREEIEKYTQEMRNIAKRVGLSCAYDQEYLTDAPDYRSVTQSIFIDLFKKGAIVEELRPNLYDPVEGTTIAEAEVERLSRKTKLVDVRWSVTGDSKHEPVIISTTRPELICACGIVLVHPDDSRYQHLVGKSLDLPLPTAGRSKSVEIKAHPSVNMEFGSGVLMVCSFGDQNDVSVFRELGLTPFQAILISIFLLIGSWLLYDYLCKNVLKDNEQTLIATGVLLFVLLSYFLTEIYGSRAAYIHVGAIIGTIMAANVFRVIIPAQRNLVSSAEKKQKPNLNLSLEAKNRSIHNNYSTFLVLFIMLSGHYSFIVYHKYNWLILCLIAIISALGRHYFNLRGKNIHKPSI